MQVGKENCASGVPAQSLFDVVHELSGGIVDSYRVTDDCARQFIKIRFKMSRRCPLMSDIDYGLALLRVLFGMRS